MAGSAKENGMVKAGEYRHMGLIWVRVRRLASCCRVAELTLAITLGLGYMAPVSAATVAVPVIQTLEPGKLLQLPLVIDEESGPRIEIRLGVSPEGASLILDDDGRLQLTWQAGLHMQEKTIIQLLIRDVDRDEFLDSIVVLVQRLDVNAGSEPDVVSNATAETEAPRERSGALAFPSFAPLPNQVVSAGRTVTLKVVASLPGDVDPVLLVDRLPQKASFEANDDGSRTFRWETSAEDQGEHRFLFSAFHPRSPRIRVMQQVLIVVGDPNYSVSEPE